MNAIGIEDITFYTENSEGHTWHGFTCKCGYRSYLVYSEGHIKDYAGWHIDAEHSPCLCARNEENAEYCACGKPLEIPGFANDWTHRPIMVSNNHHCGNHSHYKSCNKWYA